MFLRFERINYTLFLIDTRFKVKVNSSWSTIDIVIGSYNKASIPNALIRLFSQRALTQTVWAVGERWDERIVPPWRSLISLQKTRDEMSNNHAFHSYYCKLRYYFFKYNILDNQHSEFSTTHYFSALSLLD